ncbi:MAG TPA: SAM-dependent methyltransferase [Synechococcus sp. UBA8638]|nr:SAM-dependent methyltransferase [Synechococcus sp. UBA8638]
MGVKPSAILEPTCGRGTFLTAAAEAFPEVRDIIGIDINAQYVAEARGVCGGRAQVEQGDFFRTDWLRILGRGVGSWLVLGNPPWVTNAELGLLNSTNLPAKSNFQGHRGLDALTGKANFDISEWMVLQQVGWLKERRGWIAMLMKTAVARKILRLTWKRGEPVGRADIFAVDAMHHFGAAVNACLLVLPVQPSQPSRSCDVFDSLEDLEPTGTVGYHDGVLISDMDAFMARRQLLGFNRDYIWRSGIKHDCTTVMDLTRSKDGGLVNGLGKVVEVEDAYLFPMFKSSDVAKEKRCANRMMIVPQQGIGEDTCHIQRDAPRTWAYLCAHGEQLDGRRSVIYRSKPRFSIFGVGDYTFAPWKVAISGFYKIPCFVKVGPIGEKPVVFDDTVYFLPCRSEDEADFVDSLVQSKPYSQLLRGMVFAADKRPITAEVLRRISLERVAHELGRGDRYAAFTRKKPAPQMELALGL